MSWIYLNYFITGEFLEIDLGKLWEERYNSLSFPDFKRQFFNNSLFDYDDKVTPKMQLKINYGEPGFDIVKNSFNEHLGRLSDLFLQIQRENGYHYFSLNYFKKMYNDFLAAMTIRKIMLPNWFWNYLFQKKLVMTTIPLLVGNS